MNSVVPRHTLIVYSILSAFFTSSSQAVSYTEQIQDELRERGAVLERDRPVNATPYLDEQRAKIIEKNDPLHQETSEGYSDRIRKDLSPSEKSSEGYSANELKKLEPPAEDTAASRPSAIGAVLQNESDLKPRYEGDIHFAGGLRYGALLSRTVSGGNGNFNAIYGANYAPDLHLFGEWQPYHSEWFGNFGLIGSFGISFFRGLGTYALNLTNPLTLEAFGTTSQTKVFFHALPATLGVSYRFNLLRIIRPYVSASGVFVGYIESRDDGKAAKFDFCVGTQILGGVMILLDWFEKGATWSAYRASGIRHTYLTAEYGFLIPVFGAVTYASSGLQAGLAFEF